MAGVDVRVVVEDIATIIATYTTIELERAATVGGTYAQVTTKALVANTYYYTINDSTGDLNKWYRYRFHHAVGPVNSDYSDPFRVDGVTRLRARQAALLKYGAGMVLASDGTGASGGELGTVDYRVKTSLFRADRGKGSWLLPTTGTQAGLVRIISASNPTTGKFTVLPAWSATPASGEEIEWHWLADPIIWEDAMNRGLARYYFLDRVPINGVANQDEYDLSGIPWLIDQGQVHDVRYYPRRASSIDDGVDHSWAGNGRWWRVRQDKGILTLSISPAIDTSTVLYLETTRPMLPVYTDASALPAVAAEELVVALIYDEVLAYLSRPSRGSAEERGSWIKARAVHTSELHKLLVRHRPKPRVGPAQLPFPPVVPQPFQSR